MNRTIHVIGRGGCAPRKIVVLRALQLGDMLCAVPALRALRAAMPEAEITLVALPWAKGFVERFHAYLDRFMEFPGFPGLPERTPSIEQIPAFLSSIQQERFDLAIQLHGSGSFVNPLVALFGATSSTGFYTHGDYCPDQNQFMVWPQQGLEIRRLLALMQFLGLPAQGEELEFPITPGDSQAFYQLPQARELLPDSYICIHAGASVPERRWGADNFAAVGRVLADLGFDIVLTGTAAEADTTLRVSRGLSGVSRRVIDLTGRTGLGALGVLLSRSRLVITNDTGTSHIAAALRVPSVVISTGDNPARWAPIDTERHRVLCRDEGVLVSEVVKEAKRLLRINLSGCGSEVSSAQYNDLTPFARVTA